MTKGWTEAKVLGLVEERDQGIGFKGVLGYAKCKRRVKGTKTRGGCLGGARE